MQISDSQKSCMSNTNMSYILMTLNSSGMGSLLIAARYVEYLSIKRMISKTTY